MTTSPARQITAATKTYRVCMWDRFIGNYVICDSEVYGSFHHAAFAKEQIAREEGISTHVFSQSLCDRDGIRRH